MKTALTSIKVIDISVNAPGPFASMVLADMGAEVISVVNPVQAKPEYAGAADDPMLAGRGGPNDALARGKSRLPLNLKSEEGRADLLQLVRTADVFISEMRPGKLEALGLGWEVLGSENPRLVLCEITGYGSKAPHAARAGHDINYLALSGVLSLIRDGQGKPVAPQNIIGDYAAGGTLAVSAILAALLERGRTDKGQRICLSMTDGVRYLLSDISAATVLGGHPEESWRGSLSGGMPTYDTYATSDGGWVAAGALEPKFIAEIGRKLGWPELSGLMERKEGWPEARKGLTERFKARSLDDWSSVFADSDACVTPVLSLAEAHPGGMPELVDVVGQRARSQDATE
ncbi:CaiB/BaiF CoA transferase family protein [Mesorhizobium newzealandense]|uniref:CaiB/BaiF CoA transferase family protein n=1 Tax=Mesorhizobium newzealandense TaxID=1300302 RepID=A0ABW4UCY7_9HYPH|nr:CaiB/BaiF CoA-transferase family protein [Mesorhizobium sophorae]